MGISVLAGSDANEVDGEVGIKGTLRVKVVLKPRQTQAN